MAVYTSVAPATTEQEAPEGWPSNWTFPGGGALPPGYTPSYTTTLNLASYVYPESASSDISDSVSLEIRNLDDSLASNDFVGGTYAISAMVGDVVVPIRVFGESEFSESVSGDIEVVSATEYGADVTIEFELDESFEQQEIVVTCVSSKGTSSMTDSESAVVSYNAFYNIVIAPVDYGSADRSEYFQATWIEDSNVTHQVNQKYSGQYEGQGWVTHLVSPNKSSMYEITADGDTSGNWDDDINTSSWIFGTYSTAYYAKHADLIRCGIDLSSASSISLKVRVSHIVSTSPNVVVSLYSGHTPEAGTLIATTTYNFTSTGDKTITLL